MVLKGSHGTTITRKEAILKNGFKMAPNGGRAGNGVYFWRKSPLSKALAVAWYLDSIDDGKYRSDKNSECAIVFANISIDNDEEFLDLEKPEIRDALTNTAIRRKIGVHDKKKIFALYNIFVSRLEENNGVKYKVLQSRVAPPRNSNNFYSIMISGAPLCFIVRDCKCVFVEKTEEPTKAEILKWKHGGY